MARGFNGTTQYLENAAAARSSFPVTICCAFRIISVTGRAVGLCCYSAGGTSLIGIEYLGSGIVANYGWRAVAISSGNAASERRSTVNTTAGWHYVSASWSAITAAPTMYVDGTAIGGTALAGSGTVSATLTGIGSYLYSGARGYGGDEVAECAIYSSEWSAGEHIAFTRGLRTPDQISRDSLLGYWPLGGRYGQNDRDRFRNGYDMTATGSPTWVDHPRIVYPQPMILPSRVASAGGVAKPVLFHNHYMNQGMRP